MIGSKVIYPIENNLSTLMINQPLQLTIKCGVSEGSILGPLLFLLYVNDLPKASNRLTYIMFADYTNLFLSHRNHKSFFKQKTEN